MTAGNPLPSPRQRRGASATRSSSSPEGLMASPDRAFVARAAAVALAALLVYLALGQNLMHGFDAFYYLRDVDQGELHHPRFAFYLPVAYAFAKVLAVVGVRDYEALRALSSLAAAAGVFCVQLAALRLGFDRTRASVCGIAVAALPAVMYTASVVEVDAVLFACACASWLPFARLVTGGGARAAAMTGVATAIAAGFHASGHLLALTLCGFCALWDWPRRPLLRSSLHAAVVLAVHLALATAIAIAFGIEEQGDMATNTVGHAFPLDFVPHIALHEWIFAYAPIGVLALLVLRTRRDLGAGIAFTACLCGYIFVSTKILGYQRYASDFLTQGNIVERGSFLLALAVPMALLTVKALPVRLLWIAVAASAISGFWQIRAHDWPTDPEGTEHGVAAALARGPIDLFAESTQEWAEVVRRHPQIRCTLLGEVVVTVAAARARDASVVTPEIVLLWFAMEYDRAVQRGAQYVVTQRALAAMQAARDPAIAQAAERLPQLYAMEPAAANSAFAAFRLVRK